MIHIRNTLISICVATASLGVFAQGTDEHKEHHPEGAAPAAAATKAPGKSMGAEKMAAMDQRMKDMQAMHEKMMSAKTPEERQALMAEHMKTMQEGMTMMKQMGGNGMKGDMAGRQQMMEKRMDMMESMMQMMLDRLPASMTK